MTFKLPDLPYAKNALEPHISATTLSYHYDKHHKTYAGNLNKLIESSSLKDQSLDDIIQNTAGQPDKAAVFNNAAQVWNHTFYWNCMSPNGGGSPKETLLEKINSSFGDFDTFKKEFKQAAISQFGSGWAWAVYEDQKIKIMKTANADLPLAHGKTAILTCDVWEHAYYLDYQNRRPDYVDTFLEHLVNWDFVNSKLV